jgi:Semialdehyde dehydrogenase, NAD binding domain
MKFLGCAVLAFAVAATLPTHSEAFAVAPSKLSALKTSRASFVARSTAPVNKMPISPPPQLSMSYSVAIVGATGAVGKEIRTCLEARNFPVSQLRIFGSARSAGTSIETEKYGTVQVELFDVAKARECDVVFLAVSGDFALEHAEAIAAGDEGSIVIDNSVRQIILVYCHCLDIFGALQHSEHCS